MESMSMLVFSAPPSLFLNALSVINLPMFAIVGFLELRGINMEYSKFFNYNNNNNKSQIGSRKGMFISYAPAFLASSLVLFLLFPHESIRMLLLNSALALHFFKRVFEVLFVHKYSGNMVIDTAIQISVGYVSTTACMIYAQHLSQGLEEPQIDLKYIGFALFLIGITGNFYHHYLLSQSRIKGDKRYKIPKGGLFNLVICPHYLFEIIGFLGFSFISQTLYSLSVCLGTIFYLMGRSYATRQWYLSKFEDFPQHVRALFPYVF